MTRFASGLPEFLLPSDERRLSGKYMLLPTPLLFEAPERISVFLRKTRFLLPGVDLFLPSSYVFTRVMLTDCIWA